MTPPRSLAEIVEEGERLEAVYMACPTGFDNEAYTALRDYYAEHGPRLLAVARAAMESANDGQCALTFHADEATDSIVRRRFAATVIRMVARIDAAAAGADEGEGRG